MLLQCIFLTVINFLIFLFWQRTNSCWANIKAEWLGYDVIMALIRSFCCCCNTRSGTLFSAFYAIVSNHPIIAQGRFISRYAGIFFKSSCLRLTILWALWKRYRNDWKETLSAIPKVPFRLQCRRIGTFNYQSRWFGVSWWISPPNIMKRLLTSLFDMDTSYRI